MDVSSIGLLAVFAAGIISFLSPCVLPLVPGYVSYVTGQSVGGRSGNASGLVRGRAAALSLCFVLGFSTIFVLLGASATALGQLLLAYRYELNVVGGAIVIVFGLLTLGVLNPSWLQRDIRFDITVPGGQPAAAYILGMAFAFGWTPCIGPILGAILTVSAASATVSSGVALLGVYSLGLGVPFVVTALLTDGMTAWLSTAGRWGHALKTFAGAALVLMGVAMITGYLTTFSFWLLDAFPILSRIG
jgi:cytochrome c-type biogenesis protein